MSTYSVLDVGTDSLKMLVNGHVVTRLAKNGMLEEYPYTEFVWDNSPTTGNAVTPTGWGTYSVPTLSNSATYHITGRIYRIGAIRYLVIDPWNYTFTGHAAFKIYIAVDAEDQPSYGCEQPCVLRPGARVAPISTGPSNVPPVYVTGDTLTAELGVGQALNGTTPYETAGVLDPSAYVTCQRMLGCISVMPVTTTGGYYIMLEINPFSGFNSAVLCDAVGQGSATITSIIAGAQDWSAETAGSHVTRIGWDKLVMKYEGNSKLYPTH
jgi:hypothetical protein